MPAGRAAAELGRIKGQCPTAAGGGSEQAWVSPTKGGNKRALGGDVDDKTWERNFKAKYPNGFNPRNRWGKHMKLGLGIVFALFSVLVVGANVAYPQACSPRDHAATALAALSSLSDAQKDLYCNLINGLDDAGLFSTGDVFYIYTTNVSYNALLNLLNPSAYKGTVSGGMTFSASNGYTGDGSSGYIDTGFNANLSTPKMTQNSATALVYTLSKSMTPDGACDIGNNNNNDFNSFSFILPWNAGGAQAVMNNAGNTNATDSSQADTRGSWVVSRTSSADYRLYKNGNPTFIAIATVPSTNLQSNTWLSHACRFGGSGGGPSNFSAHTIGAIWLGAGLTNTQQHTLSDLINTYMTGYGKNVY
jgi:hypothetical protein